MSANDEPRLEFLLPLYLISLYDGILRGRTRLQKLAFLAQESLQGKIDYDFRKAPFGPLSYDLYSIMEELSDIGFVEESSFFTDSGNEVIVYQLTKAGKDYIDFSLANSKIDPLTKRAVDHMFEEYGGMPYVDLLDRVHEEYPEYVERIDE